MGRSRPTQRVTLAAVARLAGVAESTASRVMNGYTRNFRVRPEVRQRVIDAAIELNYKPNPMVRTIAAKRTNLVAILGSTRDEEVYAAVRAAVRVLTGASKHVCTSFLDAETSVFGAPSWRVDGAIAVRPTDAQALSTLVAQGASCVSIDGSVGVGDTVCTDERTGVRLAFEHLRERGHESIVYARAGADHAPGATRIVGADRRGAYESLCDEHAIAPLICETVSEGDTARALGEVSARGAAGVIASDTPTAMRLLQGANGLGVPTPGQLSIVCLGDTEMARLATPSLTCVRQPLEQIGRTAAGLLLERLNAPADSPPSEARHETFAGELIERQSTPTMQRS